MSLKTKQTQDAVEGEGEVEVEAYASVTCRRNMPIAARTNSAAGWTSRPEALRKSQEAINGLPREEDPGATYGPEFIGTLTGKAAQLAKNKAAQLPKGKKRRLDPSASSSDHEVEVVDESSDSASSPEDEGWDSAFRRKKKDGRGHSPKDPSHDGCFTAEALKAKKVFAKRLKQGRDEERALDPSAVLKYTKKVADMRYKKADLIQEYRDISSAGLGAVVTERVAMLQKMAQGCSNLKGTTVQALWNTSAHISAAAAVLNQRAQQPGHAVAEAEWEDIRKEVRQLKGDLTHLRAENESFRSENENLKAQIKKLEEERSRVAATAPSPQPTPSMGIHPPVPPPEGSESAMDVEAEEHRRPSSFPPNGRDGGTAEPSRSPGVVPTEGGPKAPKKKNKKKKGKKGKGGDAPQVLSTPAAPRVKGKESAQGGPEGKLRGLVGQKEGQKGGVAAASQEAGKKVQPARGVATRSSSQPSTSDGWNKVVGRRAKQTQPISGGGKPSPIARKNQPAKGKNEVGNCPRPDSRKGTGSGKPPPDPSGVMGGKGGKGVPRLKAPTSAAVCITCPAGKYSEVMRIARSKVPLSELGIKNLRCKRAITGALLLEVPGPEGDKLADTLAIKLRVALAGEEGVRVDRPSKKAEVRLHNLEDSVTVADIAAAVADASGGDPSDIRVGGIKRAPNGLGTAWVRCPVAVARKVAEAGRILVGWGMARVEVLAARPLQCFRCLEEGHVRQHCRSDVDRSGVCYRCGGPGHRAAECTGRVVCPVCSTAGREATHRLGGEACIASQKKKGKRKKGAGKARTSPPSHSPQEGGLQQPASQEPVAGPSGLGQVVPPPKERRDNKRSRREEAGPSAPEDPMVLTEVQMEETRPRTANVGHTTIAQDLFLHSLTERGAGLGVASEPDRIPADDTRGPTGADYEEHLDRVAGVIRRCAPHPVVVAGDFNAKSGARGSPVTNHRGRLTEAWAASTGLHLFNEGSVSTCVRPQGESIIDLTWVNSPAVRAVGGWRVAEGIDTGSDHLYIEGESIIDLTWVNSPAVRAVGGWRVAEGIDTGSDHLYIEVILSAISPEVLRRRRERERGRPGRWAFRKMDEDALKASIAAAEWARGDDPPRPILSPDDVEEEAEELGADMERACDASMPRVRPTPFRSAYWWTEEIAELRRSSVQARRRMQRTRRAGNVAEATRARRAFRAARKALRVAIVKAKARSWEDMFKSLDKDPWGRPYRIILQRLRPWAPPVTESLEPPLLDNVVGALFPEEGPPPLLYEGPPPDWNEEWERRRCDITAFPSTWCILSGPIFGRGLWGSSTETDSSAEGACGAGSRRGLSWSPCCGTSHTTACLG
ncbi:uncharacterized protein LOC116852965 [Odontomachus brunneus]|uniref:uncharacterized protein LOC116852965 n=1 Tax=Odontomachus brunneus TaxID=486640 RepID=UPI0013F208B2|nr:uncharacterized protein LOC116852965 [Odontomachus brunneus]